MSGAQRLHVWAHTDVGMRRKHNEDSYVIEPSIGLYAVADGMGGHDAGDVASRSSLDGLKEKMLARRDLFTRGIYEFPGYRQDVRMFMEQALQDISYGLYSESKMRGGNFRMGTTLCAMAVLRDFALVAHVGDSRCYLLRGGIEYPLTEDHSLVVEQYKMGMISREEMANSPQKNVITRALGMADRLKPELFFVDLQPGDRFLLCSDGLHSYLRPGELPNFMQEHGEANLAHALVDHANRSGGSDNVTVIVLAVDSEAEGRVYETKAPQKREVEETRELPRIKGPASPSNSGANPPPPPPPPSSSMSSPSAWLPSSPPPSSPVSSPSNRLSTAPPSSASGPLSWSSPSSLPAASYPPTRSSSVGQAQEPSRPFSLEEHPPKPPEQKGRAVGDHTLAEFDVEDFAMENTHTDLEMPPLTGGTPSPMATRPQQRGVSAQQAKATESDPERCLQILGDSALFGALTYQELRKLASIGRVRGCRPGEILWTQGAVVSNLWLFSEGEIELFRDKEPIWVLSAGDSLGESEIESKDPAYCTAIVRKAVALVEIEGQALLGLLGQDPVMAHKFQEARWRVLTRRLRDTIQTIANTRKAGGNKPR